ncbi:aldehyde dehydrogenase family protein [Salisediminibacterium halotolerans]|uniref:Aldehyde dehydrogenase (NAD+) n=1 Tax=Salisediminibacterium halotolerans TaxID=517425 RepID=A0A1H9T0M1_9BACI|nr:aldehyde dehydrogenase family protein [Salisediminibacterium haloalkalitolerans]SER90775.1 aldehyde dehydrogenase (NAD+) [Salisediminibacterium haloalkalitolerans]
MRHQVKQYINGEWGESTDAATLDVINPATEEVMGKISAGTVADTDKAVAAAKSAFPTLANSTKAERIKWLKQIVVGYEARKDELIQVMTEELGSPLSISEQVHYQMGLGHFKQAAESLESFSFEEDRGGHTVLKESVGVSALITPWNFPTNQTSTKIASAIAAGSPVILNPASMTPFAAMILAEIIDESGLPDGAFNLVTGSGSVVGDRLSRHPDIDFVSFTGSGETGKKIMQNGAETIKRVALELGGKSPLIVLDDADVNKAAKAAAGHIMNNSGQVCSAATRVLIPQAMKDSFEAAILDALKEFPVGDPQKDGIATGPLVSKDQWDTVQSYIEKGKEEATLLTGGTGKPEGLTTGYYAKPTVFTDVSNDTVIAQEEIFGPVTTILTYEDLDHALELANDTIYGLAGYIVGNDPEKLRYAAANIRSGRIKINDTKTDFNGPFGGYKQSGIGREWGDYGIEEYLEIKSVHGMPGES